MKKVLKFILLIIIILGISLFFLEINDINLLELRNNSVVENVISKTSSEVPNNFKNSITNTSGTILDDEITNLIEDYTNLYFKSLYTLSVFDNSDFFNNYEENYINQTVTKLVVETRKLYDYDFTFNKGYYDIEITNVEINDNIYTISYLESDTFYFDFLDSTESKSYDIENTITIEKTNNDYKITKFEKVQGEYIMFTDEYSYNNYDDESVKQEIDNLYNKYYNEIKTEIENNKILKVSAQNNNYTAKKTCLKTYDRKSAVEYSYNYINTRNDYWDDYSELGGNCQNYVSQAIYYSGIDMDYGDDITSQWKHYDSNINEYQTASGRSYSWTGVDYFYNYVKENNNDGICGEVDVNLYYAEIGDVIQVGYNDIYRHSTIVSKIENNHILVNSNSNNLKDYPVDAYVYPLKRLIKILGSN